MKTDRHFPIEITPEEREAGFRLVNTRLELPNSDVVVAALPLNRSARIVKTLEPPDSNGISTTSYLLEVYCIDTHFMMKGHDKPQWRFVWKGACSTLDAALQRFITEPLNPLLRELDAPEESHFKSPDSDANGNA